MYAGCGPPAQLHYVYVVYDARRPPQVCGRRMDTARRDAWVWSLVLARIFPPAAGWILLSAGTCILLEFQVLNRGRRMSIRIRAHSRGCRIRVVSTFHLPRAHRAQRGFTPAINWHEPLPDRCAIRVRRNVFRYNLLFLTYILLYSARNKKRRGGTRPDRRVTLKSRRVSKG